MAIFVRQRNPTAARSAYSRTVNSTKKEVAVGFPAGKADPYSDGTQVAQVAAYHVYGLEVPKRDFMGLAQDEIVQKTGPIIRKALTAQDIEPLYESAGRSAKDAIRNAIADLVDPPNSPVTIAIKGSSNPLIDTGHMLESVTYEVRDRTR